MHTNHASGKKETCKKLQTSFHTYPASICPVTSSANECFHALFANTNLVCSSFAFPWHCICSPNFAEIGSQYFVWNSPRNLSLSSLSNSQDSFSGAEDDYGGFSIHIFRLSTLVLCGIDHVAILFFCFVLHSALHFSAF